MDEVNINQSFLSGRGFLLLVAAVTVNNADLNKAMDARRLLCVHFAILFMYLNLRVPNIAEWLIIQEKYLILLYPQSGPPHNEVWWASWRGSGKGSSEKRAFTGFLNVTLNIVSKER